VCVVVGWWGGWGASGVEAPPPPSNAYSIQAI